MTIIATHERFLTLWRRRCRRDAAWMAAVVAACAGPATDAKTADVGSVSITPPSTTVAVGAQIPLQARVQDPSGRTITGMEIFWSVQNAGIATVSNAGVVTGVALGSTQVAASVNGKSGVAAITVEKTPVASVVVTPPHVDAAPGVQTQMSATVYDAAQNPLSGRTITWSTSNATVANVDANGMMTAVSTGSATITATSEGKSGTATITVTQAAVASVAVAPTTATILVTQTKAFAATTKDAQGNTLSGRLVTWSSSNPLVATMNSSGVATGLAPGTVTITATSEGRSGTATLTVNLVPVATVTITPPSPDTVFVGYTTQLAAVTKDSAGNVLTGRVVTWQSNQAGIATVDATGLVTGVAVGSTNIAATSEGKSASNTLTSIKSPVGTVTVVPNVDSVTTTGSTSTRTLAATVKDVKGNVVTDRVVSWTSTSAAATVSPASGASTTVTGASVGTAQVIAASETKADTASIKVMLAVTSVTVSPTLATLSVLLTPTVQLTATATNAGTTITGRAITWSSDNTAVATVDATGKVTARGVGIANITARAVFDGVTSAPATITVTP
jgi:uncharacterized protein YjdB